MPNKTLNEIANEIKSSSERIHLIYAFNGTGKTRLSKEYKDVSKNGDIHTGVYYNAYSEDLFYWDNDTENEGYPPRLLLEYSSLNKHHNIIYQESEEKRNEDEKLDSIREKLKLYNFKFDFKFELYEDEEERGIEFIYFWNKDEETVDEEGETIREWIKISRGEERIFIWCFFLALFEIDALSSDSSQFYFIDDPVSSLDDNNLFLTANLLFDLIETNYAKKKFIITSHHIGFINILSKWLKYGEQKDKYTHTTKVSKLECKNELYKLVNCNNEPLLYHLYLIKELDLASKDISETTKLKRYHIVLLRQVLESTASFLGAGHFSFTLQQLGYNGNEPEIINALSHTNFYAYDFHEIQEPTLSLIKEIIDKLLTKYHFRV